MSDTHTSFPIEMVFGQLGGSVYAAIMSTLENRLLRAVQVMA